jgi:hypothetical protein
MAVGGISVPPAGQQVTCSNSFFSLAFNFYILKLVFGYFNKLGELAPILG